GNAFTPLLGLYWDTFGFGELAVNTLLSAYVVGIIPLCSPQGTWSYASGRNGS
ncbi:MFS transporter, partial [Streptomyces cavourensis]